jgi:serine/threonine protein kinase/tetratricopeptide (TPR) repeat protein
VIGKVLGHYRVTAKLGAGGMGEVYRARDEHLDRDVALKVLPPGTLGDDTARRRFRREAEALSRLNHAHIATVHDFDSSDGIDFLVMEYVPGQTLSDRIAAGPLPEKDLVSFGADIAAALEEAHERGVVHRDLKPANIIVMPKGRVKVLDFGLAQLSGTAADIEQTTTRSDSGFEGTLPYMAPEQVRGEVVDARTDVYALGVVLYEAATGRRPFDDTQTGRLTDAILHQPVRSPAQLLPRLDPEIERIILKCLDRDPENRYQSAKEVGIDLRRLGSPATAHQTQVRRHPVRQKPVAVGLGLATVALLAVVVWLWRNQAARPSAMTADGIASVVALPSKVVAQAADQFLTDAIPNTISAHLTQVKGLETKMPPSSVDVERVRGDLGKLADMYGVSAFVLTSLTADTDRLVLNVQLVEARSRRLLWSRDFEGRRDGYLALARGAAEELRAAVRPQATPVIAQSTTSSSEAELAYQRGMHHFNRYNYQHEKKDFAESQAAFQQALKLEPRMADAAAGIAWLQQFAIEAGTPVEQALPEMRLWAQRALEMDERNSRAWAVKVPIELLATPSRPRDALVAALRAATYGPRDAFAINTIAIALYSNCSSLALASVQEAGRQDPLYLYAALNASELLVYLNRPAEALAYADNVLRVEADMPVALIRKALALIELERSADLAAVIPILQRHVSEGRSDAQQVSVVIDGAAMIGGDAAKKRAALDRLEQQAPNLANPFMNYPPVLAWLARNGRTAGTLTALERRIEHGQIPYDFIRLSPAFKGLATNARFVRAIATARAQFDDTVALLKEADARSELPPFMRQALADLLRTLGIAQQRASLR